MLLFHGTTLSPFLTLELLLTLAYLGMQQEGVRTLSAILVNEFGYVIARTMHTLESCVHGCIEIQGTEDFLDMR